MTFGVPADRAVGETPGGPPGHAAAQPRHPDCGDALVIARIELWNYLALQHRVEPLGLGCVPGRIVAVFVAVADGPAHLWSIRFRPPAVQLREIQAPIDQHLHTAGAAGFPGPARR